MLDTNNFSTLRTYFRDFQAALGMIKKEILTGIGQSADHCFRWASTQWDMPTSQTYASLLTLPLKHSFLRREYESLRREYESLRREYESLRYTFNNQNVPSVLLHEPMKQNGHVTPKPLPILSLLIKTSSNRGELVLDPFLGSGTTAVAAQQLGRNYLGIELNPEYVKIAEKRLMEAVGNVPTPSDTRITHVDNGRLL